ncbi:lectin-like domain-containing protein [Xanthocytophaga agilis]|uniref:T9SS type A sorting domain-containing protein n=1 Tax=Xanthocytophaga agilis TaxID=3048010 RepID=A0AAE3RCK1_9BACT|nr:T9SS type A sorting domain-containing protein [Xanthocytophaga agilis]MDJ1505899.1 T9SS type A sorting domain-containing protein [Xanthocytophaga agilis]
MTDALEAGYTDANGDGVVDAFADTDKDGWNDTTTAGYYLFDTDNDGVTDYRDTDSDSDGVSDLIEGHDADFNGMADRVLSGTDTDNDGLDNNFDTDNGYTYVTPKDADADGVVDFKDSDDDNDGLLTKAEDYNANTNWADDLRQGGPRPDYLKTSVAVPSCFNPTLSTVNFTNAGVTFPATAGGVTVSSTNANVVLSNGTVYGGGTSYPSGAAGYGTTVNNTRTAQLLIQNGLPTLATATISFSQAVQNATIQLWDIDASPGQFIDRVTINGYLGSNLVTLSSTNVATGSANTYIGSNTIVGNSNVNTNSTNGNVTISFPSTIDRIVIVYRNNDPAQGNQGLGIGQITWCPADRDNDGVADLTDLDDDNDGILDTDENGGVDPFADVNSNGIPNYIDPSFAGFVDSNSDGINDNFDFDKDGIINQFDIDSDNDGIPDAIEANSGNAPTNYIISGTGTGRIGGTINANGRPASSQTTPLANPDTDSDGKKDFLDKDSDNDGLTDALEAGYTDANGDGVVDAFADTDKDGWNDATTATLYMLDTDSDNLADYRDTDSDSDGVSDLIEGHDADFNGVADRVLSGTDTDNDGLDNNFDTDNGYTYVTPKDADADGVVDFKDSDDDNDGFLTRTENYNNNAIWTDDLSQGGPRPDYLKALSTVASCYNPTPSIANFGTGGVTFPVTSNGITVSSTNANVVLSNGTTYVGTSYPSGGAGYNTNYGNQRSAELTITGGSPSLATATINFGQAVQNATIRLLDIDASPGQFIDRITVNGYLGANLITLSSTNVATGSGNTYIGSNTIVGTANVASNSTNGNVTISFPSTVDRIIILYRNNDPAQGDQGLGIGQITWCSTDRDNDGVVDLTDLDDDNDGLLDTDESGGVDPLADANANGIANYMDPTFAGFVDANSDGINDNFDEDKDGIINIFDLDSDNDGITDAIEANGGTAPANYNTTGINSGRIGGTINANGRPASSQTTPLANPDTDSDGKKDFLDTDSDNDGVLDRIEGHDANFDGAADTALSGTDSDKDGLDNNFDPYNNSTGTANGSANTALPQDTDSDGTPDYRDTDDDNDGVLTATTGALGEDANSNGNWADDKTQGQGGAGRPNYLYYYNLLFQPNGNATGSSACASTGNSFRLTPDVASQIGSVWRRVPLNLNYSFEVQFNAYFGTTDALGADGITFALQTAGINAIGASGTGIGMQGVTPSVIVEFDTYDNGAGSGDITDDHIAISKNGTLASPVFAAVAAKGAGQNIEDGVYYPVRILWNKNTKTLQVYFNGVLRATYSEDFVSTVFSNNPVVYWGYTASTGAYTNRQEVCDINFFYDNDQDGVADNIDIDDDNDGITDLVESGGVATATTDADNDGVINFMDADYCTLNAAGVCASLDMDNDGIINQFDLDSDNDGIADAIEANGGATPASYSATTGRITGAVGANGMPNASETAVESGVSLFANPDTDSDGKRDYLDRDSDGDGITDTREAGGTDVNGDGIIDALADTNRDGWNDANATTALPLTNSDADAAPDYLDTDSDNDGVLDAIEGHDANFDGVSDVVGSTLTDTDNDGLANGYDPDNGGITTAPQNTDGADLPDYRDTDDDNDGLLTKNENYNGNATLADDFTQGGPRPDYLQRADRDGDGIVDATDNDDDNDGISDLVESGGVDPLGDADADGVLNYRDSSPGGGIVWADTNADGINDNFDKDGDGIINSYDLDSDNDGIPDAVEANNGVLPANMNTDGKYPVAYVNANDTDGDGFANAVDASTGGTALANGDQDVDGLPNALDVDSDSDGIPDAVEANNGVLPVNMTTDGQYPAVYVIANDTDKDGLVNALDVTNGGTPLVNGNKDNAGLSNFLDLDSDNDGIPDAVEANNGALPANMTANGRYPIAYATANDTDRDGLVNVLDINNGGTSLVNGNNDYDALPNFLDLDSDGDGIVDAMEANNGVLPTNMNNNGQYPVAYSNANDTNGDGLVNAVDPNNGGTALALTNSDGDTLRDFLDIDSDNDGIVDNREAMSVAAYIAPVVTDTDNDGISNAYDADNGGTPVVPVNTDGADLADYRDTDSDNDGVIDRIEGNDANQDGIADVTFALADADSDGLQDVFDTVNGKGTLGNVNGTNTPLQNTDGTDQPDYRDTDDDNDGFLTAVEDSNNNGNWADDKTQGQGPAGKPNYLFKADHDGDGISDLVDVDDDNDGILDTDEDGTPGGFDPSADADGDGVPNYRDSDFGGIAFVDSNTDGVNDNLDKDLDGIPNHWDLDSDNDGIADVIEAGGTDPDGNGLIGNGATITDTDGDGLSNIVDTDNGGTALANLDSDGDGLRNFLDRDSDNDGITDTREVAGTDANGDGVIDGFADANGDGFNDATVASPLTLPDTDGDGFRNYLDLDSDNDGIADIVENGQPDTDNNGRIDGFADADNDGLANVVDPFNGTTSTGIVVNLINSDAGSEPVGAILPDYLDRDSDNDGITDAREAAGTASSDANGDGIIDSFGSGNTNGWANTRPSYASLLDTDGDGLRNYRDRDSDNDGITDAREFNATGSLDADGDGIVAVTITDANGDGLNDGSVTATLPLNSDGDSVPNYIDLDSDNDGIADVVEVGYADANNDGRVDFTGTFASNDTDGDGLITVADPSTGGTATVLINTDSASEPAGAILPNYIDRDSDNDGITDTREAGGADTDGNGVIGNTAGSTAIVDANGDGWNDTPITYAMILTTDLDGDGKFNYVDRDSDNDGLTDASEAVLSNDTDGDGVVGNVAGATITDANTDGINDGSLNAAFPADTDGDGVSNYQDLDSDNDGIGDFMEAGGLATSDANNDGRIDVGLADTDGDGLYNLVDPVNGASVGGANTGARLAMPDTDGDGVRNFLDLDSDNDGISDAIEANAGVAPAGYNAGSARIGSAVNTSGLVAVTKLNPALVTDTDVDGTRDYADVDSDADGITDAIEANGALMSSSFTSVYAPATGRFTGAVNSDGIPASASGLITNPDSDSDGRPDYVDSNSDNDTYADWIEAFNDNRNKESADDFKARVAAFVAAGGNAAFYPSTDANGNTFPDWLDDSDGDGIANFLDINSSFYHDTDGDGLVDLLDPSNGGKGYAAVLSFPDFNSNGIPDQRDATDIIPLPVTWLRFEARENGEVVDVIWATASEKNSAYFEIERSSNGKDFLSIGRVQATGTTSSVSNYFFEDVHPLAGVSYYRLRQVDQDGIYAYSKVVRIERDIASTQLTAYPNPTRGDLTLHVEQFSNEKLQVRIFTASGSLVRQLELESTNGSAQSGGIASEWKLNLGDLANGMYTLQIQGETIRQTIRVVKVN